MTLEEALKVVTAAGMDVVTPEGYEGNTGRRRLCPKKGGFEVLDYNRRVDIVGEENFPQEEVDRAIRRFLAPVGTSKRGEDA